MSDIRREIDGEVTAFIKIQYLDVLLIGLSVDDVDASPVDTNQT